jgi:RecA-family ATPase
VSTLPSGVEDQYIVESRGPDYEGWFPLGEVSLVAASSGIGKTTWMIQVLNNMVHGERVFGHNAKLRGYRIVLHDRSEGSFRRTLKRMHLSDEIQKNVIRLTHEQQIADPQAIIAQIIERNPDAEIIFIEGLDMWASDPNDMRVVSRLVDDLQRLAEQKHVAIIASLGCPKQKPKDRYQLQRDSVFGSSAWGRKTETIVFLELSDLKNPNSPRRCFVMPRNGKTEEYTLTFENGVLTETVLSTPVPIEAISESKFKKYLDTLEPGTHLKWSVETGISKATFYRGANDAVEQGLAFRQNGAFYKAL